MKNKIYFVSFTLLLAYFLIGCSQNLKNPKSKNGIPSLNHDLSYIPYDAKIDKSTFFICDSTKIASGRNKLQYIGGSQKLKRDIISNHLYKSEYKSFTGFVVIRFIVNCQGQCGRFRAQALNTDFSSSKAPSDLVLSSVNIIKEFDNWKKSSLQDSTKEYSKFINLRFKNGKIQHVLL